jgi:hypothetical protein
MFFLQIGDPFPRPRVKEILGQWHFLVEICHWRFETQEGILVGSDDEQELIDSAFQRLDLGAIKETILSSPSHDLRIVFSTGVSLDTFATSSAAAKDQWTQWSLFSPDDSTWNANASGALVHHNADDPLSPNE